jgi:hypothetical protein
VQTSGQPPVEEPLLLPISQQVSGGISATTEDQRRSTDVEEQFPFGLEVLHEPDEPPATLVQIIFVHGLGGSKTETWIHPQTRGFWPAWLHDHPGLENVRLATFGYNSAINPLAANTNLSIPIFATQLLDDMKQLNDTHGSVRDCF